MNILGINAYHGDSSACLLIDGRIVAAAEEERFNRIKHWAGFPVEAIKYCLDSAGLQLSDVEHLAINTNPKANMLKKINFSLMSRPSAGLIVDRLRNSTKRSSIGRILKENFLESSFNGTVHNVEHHIAHLSSSFLVSPFEKSSVVSVDGFGDFSSACWGMGSGNKITIDGRVHFPHSLGIFYQALTQFIGFPNYGDEYKVMGLAPYGEPTYMDQMSQIVNLMNDGSFRLNMDYFIHHKGNVSHDWDGGSPYVSTLYSPKIVELFGMPRNTGSDLTQDHKNIARSVQDMYEKALFHLLNKMHQSHNVDSICLSGGCAMNSVANGKVRRKTPYKNVYIQAAAGDAGGAIGAAVYVWTKVSKCTTKYFMSNAYLGPEYSNNDIQEVLSKYSSELSADSFSVTKISDEHQLCRRTANEISNGKVIGWFQGRMEWGPRALGNRSILGDPRRSDMKDILNIKIKRRESFRPFAPSILREEVSKWFKDDDDVPFMMKVFKFNDDKISLVPAVAHVDGSGRLQTVTEDSNPRYYRLIKEFKNKTGIPILLNTSFNENEPVVCTPDQALDCFIRTDMDLLVLGNWFIQRT